MTKSELIEVTDWNTGKQSDCPIPIDSKCECSSSESKLYKPSHGGYPSVNGKNDTLNQKSKKND